jgi:hypothetical protein
MLTDKSGFGPSVNQQFIFGRNSHDSIKPLADRVVVKLIEVEETTSIGIIPRRLCPGTTAIAEDTALSVRADS